MPDGPDKQLISGRAAGRQPDPRLVLALTFLVLLVTTGTLRAMDRLWWCQCGTPRPFIWDTQSSHNSQHLFDPYTFSHIQHGLIFYGVMALIIPGISRVVRFGMAITIECGWEVIENTSWIIEKYRESTMSLDYYGDTVANSMSDIAACGLGYCIAATVPVWASLIGLVVIEVTMLFTIRDSLLLNVLMLVRPIEAIKTWQLGG